MKHDIKFLIRMKRLVTEHNHFQVPNPLQKDELVNLHLHVSNPSKKKWISEPS